MSPRSMTRCSRYRPMGCDTPPRCRGRPPRSRNLGFPSRWSSAASPARRTLCSRSPRPMRRRRGAGSRRRPSDPCRGGRDSRREDGNEQRRPQGTRGVDHIGGRSRRLRARRRSVPALAYRCPRRAGCRGAARSALVHCTKAYITSRMGRADLATAAGRAALALADEARDERERLHVGAVAALQRGDQVAAHDAMGRIAAEYPRDRIAVRLAGLNCITRGDYRGGIDIARRSLAADPGEPQYETMLGFFLEQSGFNDEGLEMSRRSLARDPTNLYTYHAVGHAYQARGDYRNALETFERALSLERYVHLVWHLAEAQAILGHERLTRDYWSSGGPPLPLHERIELVWRLEILRGRPTDDAIWRDLAREVDRALEHPEFQTTWMHHWFGVAFGRARHPEK